MPYFCVCAAFDNTAFSFTWTIRLIETLLGYYKWLMAFFVNLVGYQVGYRITKLVIGGEGQKSSHAI